MLPVREAHLRPCVQILPGDQSHRPGSTCMTDMSYADSRPLLAETTNHIASTNYLVKLVQHGPTPQAYKETLTR